MTENRQQSCAWHNPFDDRPCAFDSNEFRLRKRESGHLCLAHWPEFDARKSVPWFKQLLEKCRSSNASLATFVIPPFPEGTADTIDIGGVDLSFAQFLGPIRLTFSGRGGELSHAVFEVAVTLTEVNAALELAGATFRGAVMIHGNQNGRINMRGASCEAHVGLVIGGPEPSVPFASLNCRGTTFHEVPVLRPSLVPQDASFYGARFIGKSRQKQSEARHRALRVAFAGNSDREMEGFFYTWEKRCHRRSLNWQSSWFARIVSCLYDWTSNYGRRYELALAWLVAVQVIFGLGYSLASERWTFPGTFDSTIAAFTVGQLVRPFEPYSARAPTSAAYLEIFGQDGPSGNGA